FLEGCVVCLKRNYWSKNHPKHEKDAAFQKLKKNSPVYEISFQQYLLEIEEQNQFVEAQEFSEFDLPSDMLLKEAGGMSKNFYSNEPDTTFDQNFAEILFTEIYSLNGFEAMQTLSNRKVTHSLSQYRIPNPIGGEPNAKELPHDDSTIEAWLLSPRYEKIHFSGLLLIQELLNVLLEEFNNLKR
ncbi:hypothetical protein GcM3_192051, partial [Golovinomyces cichoracearum]